MEENLSVSIVIVTYNSEAYIKDCLNSLLAQTFRNVEIIVVDNNSTDNTVSEIKKNFINKINLICCDINSGFTGGVNLAYKYSRGEFIALFNPDAIADKEWLSNLLTHVKDESYNEAGIFASKIINAGNDKSAIDTAGDGFSTILKSYKRGEGDESFLFEKAEYVFGACAGAALYRRKMVKEIGFFDDDFFLLQEDPDLNFRAQLAGWKVLYVPTAVVHHKVRSSIGHMSDMAVYYSLRNSEFVRIKNVPFGIFVRCLPEFIIGMIMEFFYFAIKHRRLRLYFRAKMDALKMLPVMFKKRAAIMKNRNVTNKYLNSIITPVWQWNFLKSKVAKFIKG